MYSTYNIRIIVALITLAAVGLTVLLAVGTIVLISHYFKYGNAQLILGQIPYAIGSEGKCVALLPAKFENGQPVKVKISCEETKVTGKGKHSVTTRKTVFTSEQTFKIDTYQRAGKMLALPVSFEIPPELPSTSTYEKLSYEWKISFSIDVPGIDFGCSFPIPVYAVTNKDLIKYKA